MNIYRFENEIDKTILTRGHSYYIEDNIRDVISHGNGEYVFQIEGSDVYEVEVRIDGDGQIVHSVCDCPYDLGPICKHEVAAYYELLDILQGESDGGIVEGQAVKQPDLKEVLNTLSKAELIAIIAEIAQQDAVWKNRLIFKYAQGSDAEELDKGKKLIAAIVKKHTGKGGVIGYGGASAFAEEMMEVLGKAGETDNALLAVGIACLVLKEAVEAFEYADDSDGDIGWLADEAIERIDEAITDNANWEPAAREQMFHKLLQMSDSPVFDEWGDYRIGLLGSCAGFADIRTCRDALKARIEGTVREDAELAYQKRANESLLQIWLGVIERHGTAEELEQFTADNLHYSSFRESLINRYKQTRNDERVVELALEGERQDKDAAGLVRKWREIRYDAYRSLHRTKEQRQLAEQLLLGGEFKYYGELQQLTADEERDALYDRLKRKLKKEKGWQARETYLKLIAEANDLDELMAYVRENPWTIEQYADRLAGKFTDEIDAIYRDRIRNAAKSATKRKDYQNVCGMLKRYRTVAGKANQAGLIGELRNLYANRPAFMDELDQLK